MVYRYIYELFYCKLMKINAEIATMRSSPTTLRIKVIIIILYQTLNKDKDWILHCKIFFIYCHKRGYKWFTLHFLGLIPPWENAVCATGIGYTKIEVMYLIYANRTIF